MLGSFGGAGGFSQVEGRDGTDDQIDPKGDDRARQDASYPVEYIEGDKMRAHQWKCQVMNDWIFA